MFIFTLSGCLLFVPYEGEKSADDDENLEDSADTDTGDTDAEPSTVTIRHLPPQGELVYDVDAGRAHYLTISVENTGAEGVDFAELTFHAHGDMDGGENGVGNTLDVGSRHQGCVLMEQADVLAESIFSWNRGGEEVLSFADFSFPIASGDLVKFTVSCTRDASLEVVETGEFYSLRISQHTTWDTSEVTTLDYEGNPGDVNGRPHTWVAYYPPE